MSIKMTIAWGQCPCEDQIETYTFDTGKEAEAFLKGVEEGNGWLDYAVIGDDVKDEQGNIICLLYTSPSPRDGTKSRMPSSA